MAEGRRIRLGELLVDAGLLPPADLERVLELQKVDRRRLGKLLLSEGIVDEGQLTQILSHQLSVPWVSLHHIEFSRQLLNLVPAAVADAHDLVPIYVRHVRGQGQTLYLAMEDPQNEDGLAACRNHSGLPVRPMIASPSEIRRAIEVYYGVAPRPAVVAAPSPTSTPAPEAPDEEPAEVAPEVSSEPPPASDDVEGESPSEDPAFAGTPWPSQPGLMPPSTPPPPIEVPSVRPPVISDPEVVFEYEEPPPTNQPIAIPEPAGRAPRMVALTLLDGTTIQLPARKRKPPPRETGEPPPSRRLGEHGPAELTARDLVSALRAVSHGADATEVLGDNTRWEAMFAALLSLLLKKHLIADWEFVEEYKKY